MNIEDAKNSKTPTVQQMDNDLQSTLENEYFECSWEWHLARLSSVCALLYPLAFRVSGGMDKELSERRFFASAKALATYFDYSPSQVRRGLKELEELGFLQLVGRKKFKPNHYRVLSHADWVQKHKGKCTAKNEFPWTGEGDPLGQALWRVSGGQIKFADFQTANLRKLSVPEGKIVSEFSAYWEQTGHRMSPVNVPRGFYMHMKNSGSATQQCSVQ
jgi:DNA-binding transcriptional ArsR family regulator